ncbi:MAG: GNAT family N-acetyltransferase [Chloroflexota bacterium]
MSALAPLSDLSSPDLQRVAALHCAVMPTLLTDLGPSAVQRYYEIAIHDPKVVGFAIFAPVSKEALGWVMGSPHPAELTARLRRHPLWFAGQLARVAVTRPRVIAQLLRAALSPAEENLIQPGEIELTYIGVADYARGQGLGVTLVRRFLAASAVAGYNRVSLSVESDNNSAIRLYRQVGFETVKEFQEGKFHRLRMSVALS